MKKGGIILVCVIVIALAVFGIVQWLQIRSEETPSGSDDTVISTESTTGTDTAAESSDTASNDQNQELPYTIRIARNDLPVFEGPGYDYNYAATIWSSGNYTIVQEETDAEGILWGKLKSDLGWIDLAEALSEEAAQMPVTAVYAEEEMLSEYNCVEYPGSDSEQTITLAFRPNETLTDVRFCLLNYDEDGNWIIETELYTLSELLPGDALVADVEFYGDMTAYGLTFTDTGGTDRCFAIHISGRNGELLLTEFK